MRVPWPLEGAPGGGYPACIAAATAWMPVRVSWKLVVSGESPIRSPSGSR